MTDAYRPQGRQRAASALLLLSFAALSYVRAPELLRGGRLWYEEAVMLSVAAEFDSIKTLWFVIYRGHLQLFSNIVGYATHWMAKFDFPEHIAIVMVLVGIAMNLLPVAMILFARVSFAEDLKGKLFAGLIVFLVLPVSSVWASPIMAQFIFAVVCFIIIMDQNRQGPIKAISYNLLIALSFLTGPPAFLLAPAFVLKYFFNKRTDFAVNAALAIALALLQIVILIAARDNSITYFEATLGERINALGAVLFAKSFLLPLTGYDATHWLLNALQDRFAEFDGALILNAALLLVVGALLATGWSRSSWQLIVLTMICIAAITGPAIVSAVVSPYAYIMPFNAPRYFYETNVMLYLCLLTVARQFQRDQVGEFRLRIGKVLFPILAAITIVIGLFDFQTGIIRSGHDWRAQIATWRQDDRACCIAAWPGSRRYALFLPTWRSCVEYRLQAHRLGADQGGSLSERLIRFHDRHEIPQLDRLKRNRFMCQKPE